MVLAVKSYSEQQRWKALSPIDGKHFKTVYLFKLNGAHAILPGKKQRQVAVDQCYRFWFLVTDYIYGDVVQKILAEFFDLLFREGAILGVVGAALAITAAGTARIIAVQIHDAPFGMMLVRPVVIDQL